MKNKYTLSPLAINMYLAVHDRMRFYRSVCILAVHDRMRVYRNSVYACGYTATSFAHRMTSSLHAKVIHYMLLSPEKGHIKPCM